MEAVLIGYSNRKLAGCRCVVNKILKNSVREIYMLLSMGPEVSERLKRVGIKGEISPGYLTLHLKEKGILFIFFKFLFKSC